MVKKIIDTTKKQESEFAKTAGKRIVQKSAEVTGDLLEIKYLIKLLHWANQKTKKKKRVKKKNIIPSGKRQQIVNELRLF